MSLVAEGVGVVRGGATLLCDVSLALRPGELVVLCGPNGAGKSTLFDVLGGVHTPSSGEVRWLDRPLGAWAPQELAKTRALLAQRSSMPFPLSALEVVLLGRTPYAPRADAADLAAAEHALARLGLLPLAARSFPTLSGGEQQRVHIARVLAQLARAPADKTPRLLMLDEPCASLDLAHAHALYRVLGEEARRGAAVLVIDHDLARAALASRLIVLSRGRVLADGPPARVLEPALVARAWGLDTALVRLPSGALALDVTSPSQEKVA